MLTLKFESARINLEKADETQGNKLLSSLFRTGRGNSRSDHRWHVVINHGGQSIRTRAVQMSPLREVQLDSKTPKVAMALHFEESVELWDSDTSDTVEFVLMERRARDEPPVKRAIAAVSMRRFREQPERRMELALILQAVEKGPVPEGEESSDTEKVTGELFVLTSYSHDVYNQSTLGNLFTCVYPFVNPCLACTNVDDRDALCCGPVLPDSEGDREVALTPKSFPSNGRTPSATEAALAEEEELQGSEGGAIGG
ncbi:unnamed protein product, partial [Heterosigma akashiwo]